VLYFDNLSRDTADAYLADGLTEEIIVRLGQIQRLEVKSRYEVQRFRGKPGGDPVTLGEQLHAANIVTGSLQKAGNHVRVRVELVRAASRSRVWGDVFDRSSDDVLSIEEEIATAVVQGVAGQLLPGERTTLARRPTRNAEAYDLYLRGRALLARLDNPSLHRAIALFEQAFAIDSGFASAQAGLSWAWEELADVFEAPRASYPLARSAALRAIRADSMDPEAWASLAGVVFYFDWAPARAESLARRAAAIEPRSAFAHLVNGGALITLGSVDEGTKELQLTFDLDSMSDNTLGETVGGLMYARRYELAVTLARRFQHALPNSLVGYGAEAGVYLTLGDCGRATPLLARLRPMGDSLWVSFALLHCQGEDEAARRLIVSFIREREQSRQYFRAGDIARLYLLLGDRDQAIDWLERAVEAREGGLASLSIAPQWDRMRNDPRFEDLVRQIVPQVVQ